MNELLMFSGGPDSLIGWFYLRMPDCLVVNLGHKYADKELKAIDILKGKMQSYTKKNWSEFMFYSSRLKMGDLEKDDSEIPLRNAFLAMIGSLPLSSSFSQLSRSYDKIWLCLQRGETLNPSNDRSPEFCQKMTDLLSHLHGRKVLVDSPFWNMTKGQMVAWFMEKYGDYEILRDTTSCYSSEEGQCGQCPACLRRFIAFEYGGVDTTGMFVNDITKWNGISDYVAKFKAGKYDFQRTLEASLILSRFGVW